jgi:putative membrane protein
MNENYSFSEFSRQSSKGILVIYGDILIKTLKQTWILFFLFIGKFSKFSNAEIGYGFIGLAIVLLFIFLRAYLSYRNFLFKVEDNHFVLKKGILKKTNTSVAFDRIQNINFKQNLIQQIINVYGVSIETAGSKKTEIAIKALSHKKALALKNQISITKVASETSSVGKEKPLLEIDVKELLKVSLTENHLQSLVLFLAVLLGFFQQIEQVLEGLGQKEFIDDYLSQSTEAVLGSIILVIVILFFLSIIAIISSFVRVFLRHFNLVLFAKKQAFEINQGLFTKRSIILKKQKVQSIMVSTNPFKRWMGISYIVFKQAVSGKVKKKKDKLIKIVGCKQEQVNAVKEHLFDTSQLDNREKQYPDVYYKLRMLSQSFIFLIIINFLLYLISHNFQMLYSNIIVVPLFYFLVHKKFKKRFFKLTDDMLLVGQGLIETHRTYFELFKVQNVKMKQTIFQQRRNVVDIVLQTASGKIRIPCLEVEKANDIYNHILYKLETSNEPWM